PLNASPLNITQVRNAFSLLPGPFAPGEILELTVPTLVPDQPVDLGFDLHGGPLATTLGGVQVSFDGLPAYLISAMPGKIVCIAPLAISGQTVTGIQVTAGGISSNVLNASVAAAAVGLLSADASGAGYANARNADGSVNSPANPAAFG